MKGLTLFLAGFFVGVALGSRSRSRPRSQPTEPCKLALDIDEMATPTLFRRTVLVRLDPVPKGSTQTTR